MKIYEVEYPFEVDEERGLMSLVYPNLKSALKDAHELFLIRSKEEEESEYPGYQIKSTSVAQVSLKSVTKLTPGRVCTIINSNGERWCANDELIGMITWDGKRVQFQKVLTQSPPR